MAGHGGRIFIFGFLSAIAPLSIDIISAGAPDAASGARCRRSTYAIHAFRFLHRVRWRSTALWAVVGSIRPRTPLTCWLGGLRGRLDGVCLGREYVGDRGLAICASFRWFGCAHCGPGDGPRSLRSKSKCPCFVPQHARHRISSSDCAADRWAGTALVRLESNLLGASGLRRRCPVRRACPTRNPGGVTAERSSSGGYATRLFQTFYAVSVTLATSLAQPSISAASSPSSPDHHSSTSTISAYRHSTTVFCLA